MFIRKKKNAWSSLELDYLLSHRNDPITQLAGYMGKNFNVVRQKLRELQMGDKEKAALEKKVLLSNQRSKIGKRKDCDNVFLRSGWEANFYRYLKQILFIDVIQYEPTTFSFAPFGILKGTVSYTPDFFFKDATGKEHYVEVKGYLDREDKTKLKRFKKFYPDEFKKLSAVTGSTTTQSTKFLLELGIPIFIYYNTLKKDYSKQIVGWE